jgi:CspA family cold shock protein
LRPYGPTEASPGVTLDPLDPLDLAGYKIPRYVEFRSELPRTNIGKVLGRARARASGVRSIPGGGSRCRGVPAEILDATFSSTFTCPAGLRLAGRRSITLAAEMKKVQLASAMALSAIVATRSRSWTQEMMMATGTVKWFNPTKGYGFIQPQGGGQDVFVQISAVERAGLSTLNEGQHVEYEIVSNRGKSSAENLKVK